MLLTCARPVLTPVQFALQCCNDVTKLPRQIRVVKSRFAAGCEQTGQVGFVRALAQLIDGVFQASHAAWPSKPSWIFPLCRKGPG